MKTELITCLGIPVATYEFGDASHPALLFIHGNSAHSGFLITMIGLLESKYHIITLDLPGHRQSAPWEKEDFSRENFALLFNLVLNYFKISEVGAFGFSMGGFILLECFDLVPAIKKLAIAGHPPLKSVADMPEAYYLNEDSALYLQGELSEDEIERIYNTVIAINNHQLKTEIKDSLRETSPSFREGCLFLAQNASDQLARLNEQILPIVVIHATEDMVIRLEYLEKLQINNLWEQKIHLISDSGHFMITEKPTELASILDQFFSEI